MSPSGDLLYRATRQYGDRVAGRHNERELTYARLGDRAARLANALHGLGIGTGDAVAAVLDDRLENFEVYLGVALAGAVLVPVNARFKSGEVAHVLRDSAARAVIYAAPLAPVVAGVDGIDDLGPLVGLGDGEHLSGAARYEDLLARASGAPPSVACAPEDIAVIGYTSGTTGAPKGAQCSHRAIVNCTRLQAMVQSMANYGSAAFAGSFSFTSALWGVLYPLLYTGSALRLLEASDLDKWFTLMERDGATYTWMPSPLTRAFTAKIAHSPVVLNSLQTIVHTGSKVPRDYLAELADVVGDRLVEAWGMTESVGPLTAFSRPDLRGLAAADDLLASVGRPVPGVEIAVLGEDGRVAPAGATGELGAMATTMFSGYLNRPEANAESFANGWFRTGDVGRIDGHGYVYITDRCKDVIVSGGMNVYPSEIELVLLRLAGVREVSVLGVPDERWGETVAAAVVRQPGAELPSAAVVDHVRQHLAGYKKPTRVLFVDELPRNAALKVQKNLLRSRFGPETTV